MKCKFCGSYIDESKMKFCGKCGKPVEVAAKAKTQSRFCANCGNEFKPNEMYCFKCGFPINATKADFEKQNTIDKYTETRQKFLKYQIPICLFLFVAVLFCVAFVFSSKSADVQYATGGASGLDDTQNATGLVHGHEYVDLGLSVKWATCNVGANSPEDYGGYYAWGEISTKTNYTSYTYDNTGFGTDFMNNGARYIAPNSGHDTARENWGGTWRMPTMDELLELVNKCTRRWTSKNGHVGYELTGPNGNSIFLPAAGYRYDTTSSYEGDRGYYWSSILSPKNANYAGFLHFYQGRRYGITNYRWNGRSVRPVTD